MHQPIGFHPGKECSPSCIVNGLRKVMVSHHVAYLQVFKGNQVVRRDKRACRLTGKVLTLPLHLQIRSGELAPCLPSIHGRRRS